MTRQYRVQPGRKQRRQRNEAEQQRRAVFSKAPVEDGATSQSSTAAVSEPGFQANFAQIPVAGLSAAVDRVSFNPLQRKPPHEEHQNNWKTTTSGQHVNLNAEGKTIGGADLTERDGKTAELTNLSVNETQRGQGGGQAIVAKAAAAAQAMGKSVLRLESEDNGSGKLTKWYENQGFKKKGIGSQGYDQMEAPVSALQRKEYRRSPAQTEKAGHAQQQSTDAASTPTAVPLSSGEGRSIPGTVRSQMEQTFRTNFADVRIHEGKQAPAIGAVAYTQGNQIHFAPGKYNPTSPSGQALLGHELAHVVQQRQGRVKPTTQVNGLPVNDNPALEREADEMGRKARRR